MELVVIEQDSDDSGPLERSERRIGRATGHVIEREKARRLASPEDEL